MTPNRQDDSEFGGGRRAFFRDAMARAIKPMAEYIERRISAPLPRVRLRPPGAIAERGFVETCYRCSKCTDACPANAIFPLGQDAGDAARTPAIDPDSSACVVCDGLLCTHVCESGALTPVLRPQDIRMGLADVYAALCLRSRGESCTVCVDKCPLGAEAIRFDGDGAPTVLPEGCVGCGVCQYECPTTPKAIVVAPL